MEKQFYYHVTCTIGVNGDWRGVTLSAHSKWEAIDRAFTILKQEYPTLKRTDLITRIIKPKK